MALDGASGTGLSVEAYADPRQSSASPAIVPGAALKGELEIADRALCRLEGALSALADAEVYVGMHLTSEAIRSCMLAGYSTSFVDLLAERDSPGSHERAYPTGVATRCLQAMRAAMNRPHDETLSPDSLGEAYDILSGGDSEAGRRGGGLGGEGSGPADPPGDGLRDLWEGMIGISQDQAHLPPLARVGMAQAHIETVRPFPVGNGRMARLVVPLLLDRQRGLALGISKYLLGHAAEYGYLATSAAASKRWDAWLAFFLRGVAESAARAADEIRRVVALRAEHRDAVTANLGHAVGRGLRVLARLYREPLATVADVRAITGTSYVASNLLVSRFAGLGILEEVTGYRRNRVFLYGPYVRLFDTDSHGPVTVSRVASVRSAKAAAGRGSAGASRSKPPRRSTPAQASREPRASKPSSVSPRKRVPTLSDHLL